MRVAVYASERGWAYEMEMGLRNGSSDLLARESVGGDAGTRVWPKRCARQTINRTMERRGQDKVDIMTTSKSRTFTNSAFTSFIVVSLL